MSIPTKAELAQNAADQQVAAARQRVEDDFKYFKDEVSAAMRAGQSSFSDGRKNVSDELQQRLQIAFQPNWTLSFHNSRTGCTISWK